MTTDGNGTRALPPLPNLEHLKNDAKDRLIVMLENEPDAKLSDAQFALAREYGFSSWRALKDEVERRTGVSDVDKTSPLDTYTGFYDHEAEVAENSFTTVTCEGEQLFIQAAFRPKLLLTRQPDGWYTVPGSSARYVPGTSARYGFSDVRDGHTGILHSDVEGRHICMRRIDAAVAERQKAVWANAMLLQAGPRVEVDVDQKILDRYPGYYLSRLGMAIDITNETSQLFMQISGNPRLKLFPKSEFEFFSRASPMRLTFHMENERPSKLNMSVNGLVIYFYPATAEEVKQATAPMIRRSAEQKQPRTTISIDTKTLPNFVGRYQLTESRELTITAEGAQLFGQITGQGRNELYPESPRDFFFTAMPAQVSFFSDSQGPASHAVFRIGGQQITLPRIVTD